MSLLGALGGGGGGDIWTTGAFSFESPLKDLLDSDQYTLEQLLAEDELLQELRGLHPKLLDFFSSEQAVTQLVEYVISKPSVPENNNNNNNDDLYLIRFPYMACEVICCDLSCVVDTLVDGYVVHPPPLPSKPLDGGGSENNHNHKSNNPLPTHHIINEHDSVEVVDSHHHHHHLNSNGTSSLPQQRRILDLFFSLVYEPPYALDDYRAGYFEKILRLLFRKRPTELQQYVNTGGEYGTTTLLIPAMLRHLYSHSMTQIVQRLLLPHRPTPTKQQQQQQSSSSSSPAASSSPLDSDENQHPPDNDNSLIVLAGVENETNVDPNGVNDDVDNDIIDNDNDEDDPHAGEIRSDWSKSPEALQLLLEYLIVSEPHQQKIEDQADSSAPPSSQSSELQQQQQQQQQRLDLSLNAAEVLITMIQNSLLSSTTMLTLTDPQVLGRLINAASIVPPHMEFVPHESHLTAAMSVLESLILQLGGYGAIGTLSVLDDVVLGTDDDDDNCDQRPPEWADTPMANVDSDELHYHQTSTNNSTTSNTHRNRTHVKIADLTALLDQLPMLLDNLSLLLQHPACHEWTTVTQFSKDVPQPMLGTSRLRIVRVLESLVLLGDPEIDARLVQSDALEACLNLFWDFQWCSMLHQSVANLLVHVLEGQNSRVEMQEYFLIRCNLLVRLMDSFVDPMHAVVVTATTNATTPSSTNPSGLSVDATLAEVVRNMKVVAAVERGDEEDKDDDGGFTTSTSSSGLDHPLPVSEDDVDAALEKHQELQESKAADATHHNSGSESDSSGSSSSGGGDRAATSSAAVAAADVTSTEAVRYESSREASVTGGLGSSPPPQSFRYGYMGHVIIICQALVHACTATEDPAGTAGGEASTTASSYVMPRQVDDSAGSEQPGDGKGGKLETMMSAPEATSYKPDSRGDESTAFSKEPLFLAEMVACHPLSDKWNEFVATTLATETTIQSTPLGGYDAAAMAGSMQQHRPGLADDADEMGLEPPSRMGDVLDMDDNELDMAAAMMVGLSVRSPLDDDDEASGHSGDSNRSYNSGETANSGGGYLFDDPLGRLNGGLGIELGKLTKYNPEMDNPDDLLKDDGVDKEHNDDASSSSSHSSKSSDHSSADDDRDGRDNDLDVPVMDLFAGNFDFGASAAEAEAAGHDWSNFANFDDAFAGTPPPPIPPNDAFGPFTPAVVASSPTADVASAELTPNAETSDLDEIFGPGDHATLLAAVSDESLEELVLPSSFDPSSDESALPPEPSHSPVRAVSPLEQLGGDSHNDPAQDDEAADLVAAPSDELKADLLVPLAPVGGAAVAPPETIPGGDTLPAEQSVPA